MGYKKRVAVCLKCGGQYELEFGMGRTRKFCYDCSLKREIVCSCCGCLFIHYGRGKRYRCVNCIRKERTLRSQLKKATPATRIGVGSGNNQRGSANHAWNPHSFYRGAGRVDNFEARSICFMVWPKACVVCGGRRLVQAHHVDGNWKHNVIGNVVPLCKSCHIKLHHKSGDRTPQTLIDRLFSAWPDGRSKIAEKIRNPSTWESEVKAQRNGWSSRNEYLVNLGFDPNEPLF